MADLADVAIERAVLAGLVQHGRDAFLDVSDILNGDSFTLDANKIIYRCVERVLNQSEKADIASIIASASELGLYDAIKEKSEIEYIRALFNFPIMLENVRHHAKKLVKLDIARKLQRELRKIFTSLDSLTGSESIDHILSLAQKPILDFGNTLGDDSEKPVLMGNELREYVEHLRKNPNTACGIPSGFARYDAAIGGGFRRKTISLIGARTGVGKSIFATNVGIHVAGRLNIPVLYLDTEMNLQDQQNRLLAYFTKIPINNIEGSRFVNNPILEEKINRAVTKIESMPYTYKNVSGKSFEEILAIIHRWLVNTVGVNNLGMTNNCLVVYDYFKLMNSTSINGNMQEYQVLGFQISEAHNFCVKYDIPVLSFVQLNREGIDNDSTAVISQSDRLGWLCTNFSTYRDKTAEEIVDDGEECGNKKLIVIKSRHGPALKQGNWINMYMRGEFSQIEELRLRSETVRDAKTKSGFEVEDDNDSGEEE